MKTSTLLIVGGVVGGGFVLLRYLQGRAAAGGANDNPLAPCMNLEGQARIACLGGAGSAIIYETVDDLIDAVGDTLTPYKDDERANEKANGKPVEEPEFAAKAFLLSPKAEHPFYKPNGAGLSQAYWKYENGCVPAHGAPGNEKCMPGSVNICFNPSEGPTREWNCAKLGTGLPGDPLTRALGQNLRQKGYGDTWYHDVLRNCDPMNRYMVAGKLRCVAGNLPGWPPRIQAGDVPAPSRPVVEAPRVDTGGVTRPGGIVTGTAPPANVPSSGSSTAPTPPPSSPPAAPRSAPPPAPAPAPTRPPSTPSSPPRSTTPAPTTPAPAPSRPSTPTKKPSSPTSPPTRVPLVQAF